MGLPRPAQAETAVLKGHTTPTVSDFFSQASLFAQRQPSLPADGIYLFGQRPQPNQLETTYLVFEALAGQVMGAFYMPYSSFDCVRGSLQDTQLALTVTDSYSQETFAYALGLEQNTAIASTSGAATLSIDGFYSLSVTDSDLDILNTCRAYYDGEI